MLEGYFIGLKEGTILRNASLITFVFVFIPLVIFALKLHNVDLLWLSLISYMVSLVLILGLKIFRIQSNLLGTFKR